MSGLPLPRAVSRSAPLRRDGDALRVAGALPGAIGDLVGRAFGIRLFAVSDETKADIVVRRAEPESAAPPRGADPRPADRSGRPEAYAVRPVAGALEITADSDEAVFRALTTVAGYVDEGELPTLTVTDHPEYTWRGLSLDVVRRWFPVSEVERIIDLLALHKLSVLHLHLTDTQAWRFAVPGYPDITSGVDHYSAADLDHPVAYARDRFVTIVPEFDAPGHVAPTVTSEAGVPVGAAQHPFLRYLDPSDDDVVAFTRTVFAELAERFDAGFLHIGGDEAFGAPHDVYGAYVRAAAADVRRLGRRVIGWQETSRAGTLTRDDLGQLWIAERDRFDVDKAKAATPAEYHALVERAGELFAMSVDDPGRLAAASAPALVSSSDPLYLDRRPSDPSTEPAQTALWERLGMPSYEPTPTTSVLEWSPGQQPDIADAGLEVAGIEAALWCESVQSFDDAATLLLPRLALVAQQAWAPDAAARSEVVAAAAAAAPVWSALGFDAFYRSVEIFAASRTS